MPSANQVLQANARNRPIPVLPSTSQSRQAYENGDGARAKELSNEGKRHAAKMDEYNRQASEFIFRENNAAGRVEEDCIDLHGQFVEEAENILEERIRAERSRGASHLHVIVGRGNHSADHVQKIKPRVEQVCREMGLSYRTEENEGRIYIDLGGSGGSSSHRPPQTGGGQSQPHHGKPHGGQQQHHQPPQQQQDDTDLLGLLFKKLEKACCIVM